MKRLIRIAVLAAMAATGAVAGLPASPASAAPAAGSVVTLSRYVYASTNSMAVGTLNCPAGYRLVGSGGGNAQILAEAPTADFTGATIFAAVFQQPPANFAYLTITCAPASQFTDVIVVQTNDHRYAADLQPGR